MFKQNMETHYMQVTSSDPVSEVVYGKNDIYPRGALKVEGGGYFGKGIRVGNQETTCNGLIYYDTENFYGVSEKFGTTLLSRQNMASELLLPMSLFDKINTNNHLTHKKHLVTAVQNNLSKESTHTNIINDEIPTVLTKNALVEITMKDIQIFYIKIPQNYQFTNFTLQLVLSFHFDVQEDDKINYSYINDATVYIINETSKPINISCGNDQRTVFYNDDFEKIAQPNKITSYTIQKLTNDFFTFNSKSFSKNFL